MVVPLIGYADRFSGRARVFRHPKRGQVKMFAPDRDARLLKEYDAAAPKGESVAALARRIHAAVGRALGNTPGAIATQIRKLLKERKQRERAAAFEARRAGSSRAYFR